MPQAHDTAHRASPPSEQSPRPDVAGPGRDTPLGDGPGRESASRAIRALWARDTTTFARGWKGKVAVATVLLGLPAFLLVLTVPRWADDAWTVLLLTVTLALGYLVLRRLLASIALAAAVVVAATWALSPALAGERTGDTGLLVELGAQQAQGQLDGLHGLAVAEVDMGATPRVRTASIGARATTPMEIGSITKALTGLVIADSVNRGELRMNAPVSTYLPQMEGSRAGEVTLAELVTHTAGYADFGPATVWHCAWACPLGRNFLDASTPELLEEARAGDLATRGRYRYSSLGAAVAGQAAAAAAGTTYPELMRRRLFAPLDMTDTAIQTQPLVPGGRSASVLPIKPWAMDGYAPAGAAVSTARDLAKLATAILDGTAPGLDALKATTPRFDGNIKLGTLWRQSSWGNGQTISWHDGRSGGYAAYLGLDRSQHSAVIVLSDVSSAQAVDIGIDLLADRG